MKTRIAITAGLVLACTSVLRAQDDPQNGPYPYEAIIPAVPMMYEGADSTNVAFFLTPTDPYFSAWTEESSTAGELEHVPESDAYPVLFLSQEEALVFTEDEIEEPGDTQTAEGETIFLENVAGSDLRYWLEESVSSTNEITNGVGNSNFMQVIFIEPLSVPEIDVSNDILLPEAGYRIVHAPPAWYEWINPRLFLTQWADFWVNGTDATPVVLVLVRF